MDVPVWCSFDIPIWQLAFLKAVMQGRRLPLSALPCVMCGFQGCHGKRTEGDAWKVSMGQGWPHPTSQNSAFVRTWLQESLVNAVLLCARREKNLFWGIIFSLDTVNEWKKISPCEFYALYFLFSESYQMMLWLRLIVSKHVHLGTGEDSPNYLVPAFLSGLSPRFPVAPTVSSHLVLLYPQCNSMFLGDPVSSSRWNPQPLMCCSSESYAGRKAIHGTSLHIFVNDWYPHNISRGKCILKRRCLRILN